VPGQNLTYQFNGTAIFMSTAQSVLSGKFSVVLDNLAPTIIDTFKNTQTASCGITWSATNLQNELHTVIITTLGQSGSPGSSSDSSNFELDNFVVTQADSTKGSSNDSPLNSDSPSGFRQFVIVGLTTLFVIMYAG